MVDPPLARDVYRLDLVEPPAPQRRLRWALVALTQLVSGGHGSRNPGGYRAVIRERTSGCVVGEFVEGWDSDATDTFRGVLKDFDSMTSEEFREAWLQPLQPRRLAVDASSASATRTGRYRQLWRQPSGWSAAVRRPQGRISRRRDGTTGFIRRQRCPKAHERRAGVRRCGGLGYRASFSESASRGTDGSVVGVAATLRTMDVDQRLVAAVRDVAAYTASHQRAPWRLGWREAADLIDLRIERSDPPGAGRVVVCHYDIPSEGATGYFEVDIDTDADLVNGVLESYVRTSATWLQSSGVRRGSDLTHGVASTDRLPAIEGAGGRNYWTRYPGNRGRVKIWLSRSP